MRGRRIAGVFWSTAGLMQPKASSVSPPIRRIANTIRTAAQLPAAIVLVGALVGCGQYDPVDPLGMQKGLNPTYKAAYEANQRAPHIYDRAPTPAERQEVRVACENYVRQQQLATVGNIIGGAISPAITPYVPPTVEQCEAQHFNSLARDSQKALHNAMPGYSLVPY